MLAYMLYNIYYCSDLKKLGSIISITPWCLQPQVLLIIWTSVLTKVNYTWSPIYNDFSNLQWCKSDTRSVEIMFWILNFSQASNTWYCSMMRSCDAGQRQRAEPKFPPSYGIDLIHAVPCLDNSPPTLHWATSYSSFKSELTGHLGRLIPLSSIIVPCHMLLELTEFCSSQSALITVEDYLWSASPQLTVNSLKAESMSAFLSREAPNPHYTGMWGP